MESPLLQLDKLCVSFKTDEGYIRAVDGVSFDIGRGEIVGLVGESGCGKSVTALAVLRLIPEPPGNIESGRVLFKGEDLLQLPIKKLRDIRGRKISMIFQEPSAALSPLHRIGAQLAEALVLHESIDEKKAWKTAEEWLGKVRIHEPRERMYAYPFQLSGGMQQRVMIAMALMMNPSILIADEPTTALDVTIQAQVFKLIREMKEKETSILLITHDMGVVWEMCDRVLVMYATRIVEEGGRNDIFSRAAHPYTRGLLKSIPRLTGTGRLETIRGQVPSPSELPNGCNFQDRCDYVFDRCRKEDPQLFTVGNNHRAACFVADKLVKNEL